MSGKIFGVQVEKIREWLNPENPDTPGWEIPASNGESYTWIEVSYMDRATRDYLFSQLATI